MGDCDKRGQTSAMKRFLRDGLLAACLAVMLSAFGTCGAAGTICYGAPPGKIFTLCGDPGGEELEAELFRLLDAIFTQANRINL